MRSLVRWVTVRLGDGRELAVKGLNIKKIRGGDVDAEIEDAGQGGARVVAAGELGKCKDAARGKEPGKRRKIFEGPS